MTPSSFPEQNVVFAKDQPEHIPLPAHVGDGLVTCCWQLTWRERLSILIGGKIWHHIYTFNKPLQPQLLGVYKPSFYGDSVTCLTK